MNLGTLVSSLPTDIVLYIGLNDIESYRAMLTFLKFTRAITIGIKIRVMIKFGISLKIKQPPSSRFYHRDQHAVVIYAPVQSMNGCATVRANMSAVFSRTAAATANNDGSRRIGDRFITAWGEVV